MADEPSQLGSVEVEVQGNLDHFERSLAAARREAEAFSQSATKLFGKATVAARDLEKEAEMAARSTRLFISEIENSAQAMMRAAEERKRLGAAFSEKLNLGLNIGTGDSAQRGEDIAAYGKALDDLRAKHSPLFAAQQQYKNEIVEINSAQRLGAISADEHAAAILRAKVAYDQAAAAATALNTAATASGSTFRDVVDTNVGVIPRRGDDDVLSSKKREQDVIAYGRALDDLKAKFVPLFAVQRQYEATVEEINNAHRLGVLTTDEQAAALVRARHGYEVLSSSIDKSSKNMKINSLQVGNIGAQLNDIGVTMAMGMNPWMIAIQQGTQLNQVFSQMGGGLASLKAIGSAFATMLGPISLATIAIIGFGGMAVQWFSSIGGEVKTLDELLKEHEKNIKRLGPAYDDALKRAKNYTAEATNVVNALLEIDVEKVSDKLSDQIFAALLKAKEKASSSATLSLVTLIMGDEPSSDFAQGFLNSLTKLRKEFEPFAGLIQQLEKGEITVLQFREAVQAMGNADPKLEERVKELLKYTNTAASTAMELGGLTTKVDESALAFGKMHQQVDLINPFGVKGRLNEISDAVEELIKDNQAGELSNKNFFKSINQIAEANPDISHILLKIGAIKQAALEAQEAVGTFQKFLDGMGDVAPKGDRVSRESMDEAQKRFDFLLDFERRIGELGTRLGKENERLRKKELTEAQKAANAYRDLIKNAQDRIKQLDIEIGLIGKTGAAAEAARFEQKLLNDATDKGRTITAAQREEIRKLAEEYGKLTETFKKATLQQELMFERSQIFRSDEDAEIASRLKGAGLPVDLNSYEAGLIKANIQLEKMKETWESIFDVASDGIDSLTDALFGSGEDIGEVLKNIGRDFAKLMFNLAVTNPLKNWLTGSELNTIKELGIFGSGASSGKGGGFGGVLGNLFGAQKAVASMQVQAATVIVNGGVGGLGGLSGLAGAGGAGGFPDTNGGFAGMLGLTSANDNTTAGSGGVPSFLGGIGSPTANISNAFTGSVTKGVGGAVDAASSLLGLSENTSASAINSFLKAGGVDLNAAQTAWCAAFVNSSLNRVGVTGTGSNVANSFLGWGQKIDPSAVLKGDVLVKPNGFGLNQTGGHVGFATGATRQGASGLEVEMLSGNTGGAGLGTGGVGKDWVKAAQIDVRRATQDVAQLGNTSKNATEALNNLTGTTKPAIDGLTNAASGATTSLTNFAGGMDGLTKALMNIGGGSSGGWFSGLMSMFGGAAGATNYMMGISPKATAHIAAGFGGLFDTGGPTGGSDPRRVAGLVHEKEFVFDAGSTERIGVHNLEALRSGQMKGLQAGGTLTAPEKWKGTKIRPHANDSNMGNNGGSGMTELKAKIINVMDPRVVGDYLKTDEGEQVIMNVIRRNNG